MLKYSKYQGLGNDFIICLDSDIKDKDYSKLAVKVCNNSFTGKTDGLIVVKTNPLEMVFYNQDGSVGTMCGNGLRCFIRYCYDNKLIKEKNNIVCTKAGLYETEIISVEPFIVKAKMGKPNYSAKFLEIKTDKEEFINEKVTFQNNDYYLTSLFMGTHHTVVFVQDVLKVSEEVGRYLCHLPIFKDRTNVDFVSIKNENEINVKTYERGVGFTLACGTGACASVCVSKKFNKCNDYVKVKFELGELNINIKDDIVYMEGPSDLILTGTFN